MQDRETFDELYGYGEKILNELQRATNERDDELKTVRERHERLRKNLRGLLEDNASEEGDFFEHEF